MSKPRLIVFVGTVGSGKSTHMRLLYSKLKRKGMKVKIVFLKTGHLFAFFLEVFLAKMLVRKRDVFPIRALIEEKPRFFKKVFRLWLSFDLISVTIKFLTSIYIPLKLGYTVLVEEYIPATISDYIYLSKIVNSSLRMNSFVISYLLKLSSLCGPTQVVFLDAKDDELALRWKLRGSPNERKDYIWMQRGLLLQISKKLSHKFLYLNTGAKTIKEVHDLIMSHLAL